MTTPEEVLEKMARAIFETAVAQSGDYDVVSWDSQLNELMRDYHRQQVKAALAAASACGWSLKPDEATPEMINASDPMCGSASGPYGDDRTYLRDDEMHAIWSMMIAAAPKVG